MRYRKLLVGVVGTLAFSYVGVLLGAEPPQAAPKNEEEVPAVEPTLQPEDFLQPTPPLNGALGGDSADIMQEILTIRKMFGDLLEGTDLDKSVVPRASSDKQDEAEAPSFADELHKAITTEPPIVPPAPQNIVPPKPDTSESHVVGMLRAMCRQLGEQAEQLETRRNYLQADQLRTLAHQIRLQARAFEQGGTHPTTTPCPVFPKATLPYATPVSWEESKAQRSIAPPIPVRPPMSLPSSIRKRSAPAEKLPQTFGGVM